MNRDQSEIAVSRFLFHVIAVAAIAFAIVESVQPFDGRFRVPRIAVYRP